MATHNNITNDKLISRHLSNEARDRMENITDSKKKHDWPYDAYSCSERKACETCGSFYSGYAYREHCYDCETKGDES